MNIAFMFSGQGSEYVSMCEELYNNYDIVKNVFHKASNFLGYRVSDILFFNEQKLKDTTYTQPLMFVMYVSIKELLNQHQIHSTHTFGLSLGEYGALYDAGVITLESGLHLLQQRGQYMKDACKNTNGGMTAILGLDEKVLHRIIEETDGVITIANYNTYGQLVISGEMNRIKEVTEKALQNGAKRCIPLLVDGPFHSDLMQEASTKFSHYLEDVSFASPTKNLYVNTTGKQFDHDMKNELTTQITRSVYFYQMVENCIADGVSIFIEIGPKKVLSSFVRKINKKLIILNVEDESSLQKTLLRLENENGV